MNTIFWPTPVILRAARPGMICPRAMMSVSRPTPWIHPLIMRSPSGRTMPYKSGKTRSIMGSGSWRAGVEALSRGSAAMDEKTDMLSARSIIRGA